MKKILTSLFVLLLLMCLVGCGNGGEEENTEIIVKNGTEVAKILLANERLDQSVLKDSNKIFVSGKEAFSNVAKETKLSMTKLSKREGETYTEVDGDTYKWYNDVDYSNFMMFFQSYAENIEHTANRAVNMIEYTKKYIRVVNTWVKVGDQEILLIVDENSEIILTRSRDGYVDICKRYTNDTGLSVYEMAYIYQDTITRMEYIPGLVYEFVITELNNDNGYSLYLLADKYKGYWNILSTNGPSTFTIDGDDFVYETCNLTSLVMKEEATYILNYMNSNYEPSLIGEIQIVSSDGMSDLLSFSQNSIMLFNTGVYGLDHLEIIAPKDKVGDFDPTSQEKLYVYEQENVNNKGERYKIYSTSGHKSATAVCENGVTFTEGDVLLDGKARVNRIDVTYVAGCDSYGRIPFSTNAQSLDEQYELLKELFDYTGLTFRRDYDEVVKCIEYSIKDAQNFSKYYTINGYHINDLDDIKNGLEVEREEYKYLLNIYEQVKNVEVVDMENQEEYNSKIHFTDLEVINQGNVSNDGFTLLIENFEVKVKDTLLFVDGEEYQIVFGLLTTDNNVIPFIEEEDAKFIYKKGEDISLTLTKQIQLPVLEEGEYILAAYVSLADENIRISNFVPIYGTVIENSITNEGYKNTIKNDNENRIIILSEKDYNVYYVMQGDFTVAQLQEILAQLAYNYGMLDDIVIEKLEEDNWVTYHPRNEEKDDENMNSDSSVTDDDVKVNSNSSLQDETKEEDQNNPQSEVEIVEKGQYRMKYIANTTEDNTETYYIFVTIE